MIDPILSLAISMHSNPGVYALLIGSGVSRAAGIPTGWEVTLELIRKLAKISNAECEPDPAKWFKIEYGDDPNYSKLLKELAKTQEERKNLLKNFFEPNEEEREKGLKQPTKAHDSIAELASKGYVRIIITTNFDRLLEKAFERQGLNPTVISTEDAAIGATPLIHTDYLIIKPNGDYLSSKIKNTQDELAKYSKEMNKILDRIMDEFGLIVCGWSGEWDEALRNVLERCKSHRFSSYWCVRKDPDSTAQKLIKLRKADIIKISSADDFFSDVGEKIIGLEDISKPHPLSVKLAVSSLKRSILNKEKMIDLHDLVNSETKKVHSALDLKNFPVSGIDFTEIELEKRLNSYESITEILLSLFIHGCYWGEKEHEYLWIKCLERVGNFETNQTGLIAWIGLQSYPALLLFYASCITAIAAEKWNTVASLMLKPVIRNNESEYAIAAKLNVWDVFQDGSHNLLPGQAKKKTPVSNHLFHILRKPVIECIQDDTHYEKCFDMFEYLLALTYAHLRGRNWIPLGAFVWRQKRFAFENSITSIAKSLTEQLENDGASHPLLAAGLFDGSVEELKKAISTVEASVAQSNW